MDPNDAGTLHRAHPLATRWLLAPLYLGLSFALLALGLKFFQKALHMLPHVFELAENDLVLTILSLIDMTLVGSLLIMVMLSGYENFVSRIDIEEGSEKLEWLGTAARPPRPDGVRRPPRTLRAYPPSRGTEQAASGIVFVRIIT